MIFETGRPTRDYVNHTEINFELLAPDTVIACPYKGTASR